MPGVRPASHPYVSQRRAPSDWFLQARSFRRRRAGERSEGWCYGLGAPRESGHLHRTTTALGGQDVDLEHALQALRLKLIETLHVGVPRQQARHHAGRA